MQRSIIACLVAGAYASLVLAQEEPSVIITGTPFGSGLFELVQPADVLSGRRLAQQRAGSLGETLNGMPGVSATSFGPGASRPIIRGLDGDRIRIMQNSIGTLDASSLSFDHAVPYEPLAAERIEIVRGPAAVLYGGSAVGGVVNVIDNRIPDRPLSGFSGRAELRLVGPDNERNAGAVLEAGNGQVALHADLHERRTGDLRIPGFARSSRQRLLDGAGIAQPRDRLPNSSARSDGGALGASTTWESGHLGIAYRSHDANYGSVAEQAVRIAMQSERWDVSGEVRDLGAVISSVKFKSGRTDYRHRELRNGRVNTAFGNHGNDTRIEATHGKLGPLSGAFGIQLSGHDFEAIGEEAFVPRTSTHARGLFLYEELPLGNWKFSLGSRAEKTRTRSEGGGPADPATGLARFDPAASREFSTRSSAFGALYGFTPGLALVANVASTQRAPTYAELFANGPHAATGTYERGNATFDSERSRALDLGLRWKQGTDAASVAVFRQKFRNFLALFGTGNQRGADGELNPLDANGDGVADGSGAELMPEFQFRAVPARFRGIEAAARMRVYERVGTLDLELKGDRIKATDASSGLPLPRISPTRISFALDYAFDRLGARLDVIRASAQNRVAANELPTDGYTLVNAHLGYRFKLETSALEAFARVNNLFDREVRYHTSSMKDRAPLAGRGVLIGLRGSF
jgi:iron complex outermembrane receptor protein